VVVFGDAARLDCAVLSNALDTYFDIAGTSDLQVCGVRLWMRRKAREGA
jgi:hypothetical protein